MFRPQRQQETIVGEVGTGAKLNNAESLELSSASCHQQHAQNATRHFCDMLYEELMAMSRTDRQKLQYHIHGVLMQSVSNAST